MTISVGVNPVIVVSLSRLGVARTRLARMRENVMGGQGFVLFATLVSTKSVGQRLVVVLVIQSGGRIESNPQYFKF